MHYELLYPNKYLKASDLRGKDVTLTISSVDREKLMKHGERGNKSELKPIVYFMETAAKAVRNGEDEKRWVINKTCATVIAGLYGNDTDSWAGKKITLYPKKGEWFGKKGEAIRVREQIPKGKKQKQTEPQDPPMSDDDIADLIGA